MTDPLQADWKEARQSRRSVERELPDEVFAEMFGRPT